MEVTVAVAVAVAAVYSSECKNGELCDLVSPVAAVAVVLVLILVVALVFVLLSAVVKSCRRPEPELIWRAEGAVVGRVRGELGWRTGSMSLPSDMISRLNDWFN